MEFSNFAYLILMVVTVAGPLYLSFENEVRYFSRWKYLFPAIFISGAFFIIWDISFARAGIWSFNPRYLIGVNLLGLPVEEWLFFLGVPFACVFIYDVVKVKIRHFGNPNVYVLGGLFLLVLFGLLAWFNRDRSYTFFMFLFLAVYLGYVVFRNNFKPHFGSFYLSWVIAFVPFLVINGVLTALPVVEYDPQQHLGIRIFTIPVEDAAYFFLMHLMVVSQYEYFSERKFF